VSGRLPDTDQGACDVPLLKTGRSVRAGLVEDGADTALTHWIVRARGDGVALIEAKPHTGRMHQIRAHMADMGCPILGDPIYGVETPTADRLMLHAAALEITLPDQNKRALEAPVPDDFSAKRNALGL